jgi:Type I phosphodiesterase / nucleotide pyrophosphatase
LELYFKVNDEIMNVDSQLKSLLKGMEDSGILGCVDIMVVSDHGMASTPAGKYFVLLKDFISDVATTTRTYDGVFPNIRPNTDTQGETKFITCLFTCHLIQSLHIDTPFALTGLTDCYQSFDAVIRGTGSNWSIAGVSESTYACLQQMGPSSPPSLFQIKSHSVHHFGHDR